MFRYERDATGLTVISAFIDELQRILCGVNGFLFDLFIDEGDGEEILDMEMPPLLQLLKWKVKFLLVPKNGFPKMFSVYLRVDKASIIQVL